jgi:hypothetical protein
MVIRNNNNNNKMKVKYNYSHKSNYKNNCNYLFLIRVASKWIFWIVLKCRGKIAKLVKMNKKVIKIINFSRESSVKTKM